MVAKIQRRKGRLKMDDGLTIFFVVWLAFNLTYTFCLYRGYKRLATERRKFLFWRGIVNSRNSNRERVS
jgi:hypothetical protein